MYITCTFSALLIGYLAFTFFSSIQHDIWGVYLHVVRLPSFYLFAEIQTFSCFDFMSVRMLKGEKTDSRSIIVGFFHGYGGYNVDEDEYVCKTSQFSHKYDVYN